MPSWIHLYIAMTPASSLFLRMILLALFNRVSLLEAEQGSWRAGSAVKRTCHSWASPWFVSQCLHGSSQPTIHSSSYGGSAAALSLFRHQKCTWYMYMCMQANTRAYKISKCKMFKVYYCLTTLPTNLFFLKLSTKTLVLFFTMN